MTDASSDESTPVPPTPKRAPLEYASVVLAVAAALLLIAGIVYAFAVADAREVGGSERFRLLAQASSPFIAGLALAGIAIVVHERRRAESAAVHGPEQLVQVAPAATLAIGSMTSLLGLLLALNGIVVDLTTDNVGASFKLSNVIGRLATVVLSGFALWLSATTPLRPVVEGSARPVHS